MSSPAPSAGARINAIEAVVRRVDAVLGLPERIVFGILGHFSSDAGIIQQSRFRHLISAKFFADSGRDSIKYAALVGVIYAGGDAFASSLIGLAALIPGVVFALYGGAISDTLPKRTALTLVYLVDAAICVAFPFLFDDTILMYFMLVFVVTSLSQIASPAEQTLLPLVTSDEQLAAGNSLMGVASSLGTTAGTAILAPILLKAFGTDAVFYTAAALMLIAMSRVVLVNTSGDVGQSTFKRPKSDFGGVIRWLVANPSIGTMIGVSAVGGMGYQILTTLAPTYVSDILKMDPANTVYVMGIAGFGMMLSLFVVPLLIGRSGERRVAGAGFVLLTCGLVGLGLVNSGILDFLTPINPFHWLDGALDRLNLSEATELAMLVSFPAGMGMGLVDNSVKTFLNRRVPIAYQGRTFAIRNLSESALTIVPLLTVSLIATFTSVSAVLVVMPLVFYLVATGLIAASARAGGGMLARTGVLDTFLNQSETDEVTPMEDDADDAQ